MDEQSLEKFREILIAERRKIVENVSETLKNNEIELSNDDMPDENDLASALYEQNLALRFRGREQRLLGKISKALRRIDDGEFGECEVCGDEISERRLAARPVTTMCIACKEEQERNERSVV
jgi:DnaK suppressor protein